MTPHEAFLQAIFETPTEPFRWQMYADWLEECGDSHASLYRNREITNSVGMKLTVIPPGTFLMGSPESEKQRQDDEQQHEVRITQAFRFGVFPVTQEEYQKVMGHNPSWFCLSGEGKAEVLGLDTRRFPVERVSWYDAITFCRRLRYFGRTTGSTGVPFTDGS
jgi:uncharacterized protein (TIGR02996 family)